MSDLVPIPCARCGAAMAADQPGYLHSAPVAICRFCGSSETLPPEQGERIRFLRLRLVQLRRAAEAVEAPARSLAQIRKSWGSYLPCLLIPAALPLLSGSVTQTVEWAFAQAAKNPSPGALVSLVGNLLPVLLVPAVAAGVIVGYLMMIRAFDRAVRPLLMAKPPLAPNGHARCRTCGGELAITPAPSVTCSYCNASNLLGAELTTKRAELLEREANVYRERAQAFIKAIGEPFKAPAQVFFASAAVAAVSTLAIGALGSVALVILTR